MLVTILLTLGFYFVNTVIISIFLNIQNIDILFISTALLGTTFLWVFILITEFWPRLHSEKTLYDKLDAGFTKLNRTRLLPNLSNIIRFSRGPTKYFMFLLVISLLLGSFFQKLGSVQGLGFSIVSFIYITSLTFLANVPAYILSLNSIRKHLKISSTG